MSLLSSSITVMAGRGIGIVIQFVAGVILARVLTPDEFGVFAVAAGAASVLHALREFGSSNYLVRAPSIDRDTVGSVLVVSVAMSTALGCVVVLSAGPLSVFFGDDRVELLLYVLAANFLLVPLAMLGNALLVREQRFNALTAINTASALAGSVVMVGLAVVGGGPLALALGTSMSTVVLVVLSIMAKPKGWVLCFSLRDVSSVVTFGGWLTGMSLVSQFSERVAELVIGRTQGLAAAGLFDKAGSLVRLVGSFAAPVIHSVLFSQVAEESRGGRDMGAAYLHRLAVVSSVAWPAFLFIAIQAEPMVLLAFGSQWGEAVPVAFWLAINAMLATPFLLADNILITKGQVADLFWQKLLLLGGRFFVIFGLSSFGLVVVSAALLFPNLAYLWVNQESVLKVLGTRWSVLFSSLRQAALLAAAVGAVTLWGEQSLSGVGVLGMIRDLVLTAAFAALVWVAVSVLSQGPVTGLVPRVAVGLLSWVTATGRLRKGFAAKWGCTFRFRRHLHSDGKNQKKSG